MQFNRRKAATMGLATSMLLAFVFIGFNVNLAPASPQTTIYVEPPLVDITVCRIFTVEVKVRDVVDLYAYQFHLYWDCLLWCIECKPTPPWEPYVIPVDECSNEGKYYWCAVSALYPAEPFTGTTTLATLTFHCEGPGDCPLTLTETTLVDINGRAIPHDVENGLVKQTEFFGKYVHGEDGLFYNVHLHGEFLINLMNPIGTYWHELWPYYCSRKYHLNSWEDNGDNMLSPSDQIDMIDTETEEKTWWHVDDVTVTITVEDVEVPEPIPIYLEFMGGFTEYSTALLNPVCTIWHEVYPVFSKQYNLTAWGDNGDGVISHCDTVVMSDLETGISTKYHVVNVATDIIVTRKPVCTQWHEIYPEYCAHSYHLSSWIDNNDHMLSPCDKIDLTDKATGEVTWWHVKGVTITIIVTEKYVPNPERLYLELYTEMPMTFNPVLTNPVCTIWYEIWPIFSPIRHLSSWEDNGDGWLSPCDQIDMTPINFPGEVTWYHVDEVMIDIWIVPIPPPVHDVAVIDVLPHLPTVVQGETDPIDVTVQNQGDYPEAFGVTAYADIDPAVIGDEITIGTQTVSLNPGLTTILTFNWDTTGVPPATYIVSAVADVVPGETDVADNTFIDGKVTVLQYLYLHGEDGIFYSVHLHNVEPGGLIDLSKPICTYWHELWPYFCNYYHLNSWEDNGDKRLSPSDQIDMIDMETGEKTWWHVDDITVTIFLTPVEPGYEPMYVEFDIGWEGYDWVLKDPIGQRLHQIWPVYCRYFTFTSWEDSDGNGIVNFCDMIDLTDENGIVTWWHVEEVATDIIVTRKPVCTQWHEIYPSFCKHWYHLSSWKDTNSDHKLSPCDIIDLTDKKTGKVTWWHVVGVTITIVVKDLYEPAEPIYMELEIGDAPIEDALIGMSHPVCTTWHEIWPVFSRERHLSSWDDNSDGWLSPCDKIDMTPINYPGDIEWYHVEDVTIDIQLEPIPQPCPPKVEWTHTFGPIDYFMTFCPSPGVANLDNETGLEIVTGTDEWHGWQKWHCFDSTGAIQWILPTRCDESRTSVAIGDIDLDGDLEIAGGTTSGWETQVFDHAGSFVWRYPVPPSFYDWWHSSPAICDVDPDVPGLELIAVRYLAGIVYCFDNAGNVIWTFNTGATNVDASPACGDVDGDGQAEIVIGTTDVFGTVYCLNGKTGAVEWKNEGLPIVFPRPTHSSAAIADIDNDGAVEVVVGRTDGYITCLRGIDGTIKWPAVAHLGGAINSSPAVGDVDADGALETIVGSLNGRVYCLDSSFNVEWFYQTGGAVISSPALANRGGSGLAIYIGSMDKKLYALDGFGNLIWSFYTGATNGITSSPVIADIDGDSKLEVMFTDWNAIPDSSTTTNIFWVLEDCTSMCPACKIEWGMFRHDRCHTGKYSSGIESMSVAASEVPNGASTVEGSAEILSPESHDVAIVFDWLSKSFITAGEIVDVYVTVENQGDYIETTTVTVTYDGTFIGSAPVTLNPGENQTLTFPWDTTGVPKGVYLVTAEASVVPGETDTIDNTFSTLAIVKEPVHDIAIASVTTHKTIVGQGYGVRINITVFNQGDYLETFAVTASYDSKSIGPLQMVTLNPSEAKTVTLFWQTTEETPKGIYNVGAYVVTPILGETDLADNTLIGGTVIVTIPGDVDGNFWVNIYDIVKICAAYDSVPPGPPYEPNYDINCDGKIDIYDVVIACSHYDEKDP